MTSELTLQEIPGGSALLGWFNRVPRFHDAKLLEIVLSSKGSNALRIHAWQITDRVDKAGNFILDRNVIVTITLSEVTRIALNDFNLPAIIGSLEIDKVDAEYRIAWDVAYGVEGCIHAKGLRFDLVPGTP